MKKQLLISVCLLVLICWTADVFARRDFKKDHGKHRGHVNHKKNGPCSPWALTECFPLDGVCGVGYKVANRTGPQCRVWSKTLKCHVSCFNDTEAIRLNALGCKYRPKDKCEGDVTQIDMRLSRGGDECPETRTVLCKTRVSRRAPELWVSSTTTTTTMTTAAVVMNATTVTPVIPVTDSLATRGPCAFGDWGEFSGCVNGAKTRDRQLVAGDAVTCSTNATETIKCEDFTFQERVSTTLTP